MTTLTMRSMRGHFIVTAPDIEPVMFNSRREAKERTSSRFTHPGSRRQLVQARDQSKGAKTGVSPRAAVFCNAATHLAVHTAWNGKGHEGQGRPLIGASSGMLLSPPSRSRRPPESALHGRREFLVHPLKLLGRIGADIVAGSRGLDPKP
jgi:hypothetical protein